MESGHVESQLAAPRGSRGHRRARPRASRSSRNVESHSVTPSQANDNDTIPPTSRGQRRGRGARGPAHERGDAIRRNPQFGARLTAEAGASQEPVPPSASVLNPDTPSFQPSSSFQPGRATPATASGSAPKVRRDTLRRRGDPPGDLDLTSRIHHDISRGAYECGICTEKIHRRSWIWSCETCWTVFHLDCTRKWALKDASKPPSERPDVAAPAQRYWRCPGCNLQKEDIPLDYTCWCQKELKPRTPSGCPPSSCGQTCGKPRTGRKPCHHPCDEICHAGPCPPCSKPGPLQICFCGKVSVTKKCIETDYEAGWSCNQPCGDTMPCGEHICQRLCHEGVCGACEVHIEGRCYCGKAQKSLPCHETGTRKRSQRNPEPSSDDLVPEQWVGVFSCETTCQRSFDCSKHSCSRLCHPQDLEAVGCPFSPEAVKACPCGKTPLSQILVRPRASCEDPVPNCDEKCLTPFACGHTCQEICHAGSCPPCPLSRETECRCGRARLPVACADQEMTPLRCDRPCKAPLNCGRHECSERCCPGEAKAGRRRALNRQLGSLGATLTNAEFESEHICTRTCGRPLKCGNQTCPELCHKGVCATCKEAIFDELSCHCGKTFIQPPIPCGTSPPPCQFPCEREKQCGHPQITHNCHDDAQPCPECPYLVEKRCMCGKQRVKNRPCFQKNVSCGQECGKNLPCGLHRCLKTCHPAGRCESASETCGQSCGRPKNNCGHPCEKPCHGIEECPEDRACQSKVMITCDCQHLKNEAKCLATRSSKGTDKKALKCNDECARLERNRKLALALDIDPETHTNDHVPYSASTLDMYQKQIPWCQAREGELRIFAADDAEKQLRFKPMPSHQRAFIHSLAEDFGLDSESMDPEPHRHVSIFKTPRFVSMPMKTLAESARVRSRTLAASAASNAAVAQRSPAKDAFNAFILSSPKFALTVDELRSALAPTFEKHSKTPFDISFLPSEEVVIRALDTAASNHAGISDDARETKLRAMKPALAAVIMSKQLAASTSLCTVDNSLNLLRTEKDATEGGWNVVARSKPSRKEEPAPVKPSFVALGSRAKLKRAHAPAKGEEEDVVDDWLAAAEKEEASEAHVADAGEGPKEAD